MSYTNDSKPTDSYTGDTKPSVSGVMVLGQPIATGFFMFLTYPQTQGYSNDSLTTDSYTNDIKP